MKLPCSIVRDLLPLYHDNVCAPESAAAVEEHLTGCEPCQEFYHSLQDEKKLALVPLAPPPPAAALQRVKRRMRMKYLVIALSVLLVAGGACIGVGVWINSTWVDIPVENLESVRYTDEMVLAMEDGTEVVGGLHVKTKTDFRTVSAGMAQTVVPLDSEGREWAMAIGESVTLWESIKNKLGLYPAYKGENPHVYAISLDWYSWQYILSDVTDLKPPKEEWNCFISKVYYFEDCELRNSLGSGAPPEERGRILEENAVVIWERDKDPAAK